MSYRNARGGGYVVPSYRAPDGAPWYHFLHGNVPGHEIDFIYRPDVPQGPLTEQHFSHLARLMKYIEPPAGGPYAFAIGNLSRDDTQHEPGHGGVALLFGLRIHGALDHAGRNDPPFAHAIAAIDRHLDPTILLESARAFHQRVLGATGPSGWYRDYVRCATEGPFAARRTLETYVTSFRDLPPPRPSAMGPRWTGGGARLPKRVVIAHEDDASFESIAWCAAKLVSMLYQSDLRWTSISNGREADVPNGVSIRFVPRRDLVPDSAEKVHQLHEIPEEEAEIAQQIFDASAASPEERPLMQGWRERYSDQRLTSTGARTTDAPPAPEGDAASAPRIDEEQVGRSSTPEPTEEARASLREDPEDTRVMVPSATAAAGKDPDELSIDCSSFAAVAPEPEAALSPVAPVDAETDYPGDAVIEVRRSRRLLVGSGLVGGALLLGLLMSIFPTLTQRAPDQPERGGDVGEAPSPPIAAPPLEQPGSGSRSAPTPAVKAPAQNRHSGARPPATGARGSAKGMTRPGGESPASSGATAQSPIEPALAPDPRDPSPSSIFGAHRNDTPKP